ncbi:alpha-1,6-glucosidase, pullulanase-type [Cellulomonas flavigena DSM 20109]|uniref:Alpha-1,6-glucosidase, pullulanase-type n=1 Tax=Cellulomonas flavigena (strain ATCC 482 / DSM 20109 / BCRC 11376 / JCM 18109 / NBRC 3775 / NCIMB 8073 / NRS 134) TaxID=446466 RepID=D5UI64_CELFN|nr:pullulanase-type alpha-1,6-glucosidase [Cellulomonas flavigena]ADG75409.1 alpha-1,6-glucosidase, pullulanase-type [Cellulomonas flavigena DSM 20109]
MVGDAMTRPPARLSPGRDRPARTRRPARTAAAALAAAAVALSGAVVATAPSAAAAGSVTLVGSLQDALGCAAAWDPACAATALAPTDVPGRFSATFTVPGGTHEWKVALDGTWDAAYGADGTDANTPLVLAGPADLTFTYDDTTHRTSVVVADLPGGYTDADADLVAEPARDPGAGEQFYFVLTDRFANGDPTNDTGGLEGDRLVTGLDPTDKGFYHGGDLAGLRERLDYVEGLGTTAIWLTPSFLNRPVQGEGADASAGYHGYWITDFTRIDPHLGTNAELEALIADAHARGIKVYFDIITNHTADVVDYAEGRYTYVDQATSPYRDAAGDAFDPAGFAGTDDFPELDPATSFPYTPVIDPADADVKVPAWLNDPTFYHNRGDSTWQGESVTYGDFVGLDDLMTEHPDVVQGFVDVYEAWVDLGVDGFRIDTVKHVNREFWDVFTTAVAQHAASVGNPDFFMFGEVYDSDARLTAPYVRETDMNAVLDFSFQSAASSWARGASAAGLAALFASDDLYTTPTSSAHALPTFLGNHDMGRIGHMVKDASDPQARSGVAHALMYLTRGQPVVYYGDEQGFVGAGPQGGGDKDARQSLFATEVDEYADQALLDGTPAGSVDRYDTDAPLYAHVAALAELRASTPALTDGAQIERYADGGVYAFSRVGDDDVEHLVAVNNAGSPTTVTLDALTPGATFTPLLATSGTDTVAGAAATAGADGALTLTVPAYGAVVLRADATVATGADAVVLSAPGAGAALSGLAPVAADVADDVLATTSFAYRVVGADVWTPLGTAESTSPRVFHDVRDLAPGTLVEYRAVREDTAGHRTAASTFGSVGVAVDGVEAPGPVGPGGDLVTVPGSHNAAMGCPGDWQPGCEAARLATTNGWVYSGTFTLPPGSYEYKVAVGGTWDENYGAGGAPGGANIAYTVDGDAPQQVTFVYDATTHQVTSSAQGALVTLPGSYQAEAGCAGDWDPACLATALVDGDDDGSASLTVPALPAGSYEVKVAHGLSWAENYGAGGARDGANIAFTAPGGKPVTFTYDLTTHVLTVQVTDPPLPGTGQLAAHWLDARTIAWPASLVPGGTDAADLRFALHGSTDAALEVVDGAVTGGEEVALTLVPRGLTAAQRSRFPALADHLALRVDAERKDVERLLTGQLLVRQAAADGAGQAVTGVQVPGVLDDLYAEAAARRVLGATWRTGVPSLALWAPTAQDVDLLVWPADRRGKVDTSASPVRAAATRQADGAWTVKGAKGWADAAYLWEVTVYAPTTGKVEVNRVTDPSAVALTLDSTHGVLVDLADPRYRPREWERTKQPVVRPVDQTIYELHVRDFSVSDATVPERLRGTYGAFAVRRSDGRDHLRDLADAGLTTVHLLPTFDIASIEEDRAAQAVPDCDLAALPPDSPEQQGCVRAAAGGDAFNWGYDPWHWTAPEGSYAVDAHGGARITEFRSMVGALHADGLQVVLDQVFNHTAASGQDAKSVLDRVVPGYYHRLTLTGQVETSTCCQNVATEHAMAEKMMVDSVVTWARDHKVDGFRFDLMGHHSRQTMERVRAALDRLTPRKDGVDGRQVYLYGEGWNFGEVADDRLFEQATQGQLGGTGIGTFSDRLRDAVRGGGPFDDDPRLQGFGSGAFTDPNGADVNGTPDEQLARVRHQADLVRLGMAGNLRSYELLASDGTVRRGDQLDYNGQPAGYADSPEEVVTYVDAHDNETLFDSLTLKLPVDTSMADRVRMNTVSLATVTLAQTPSFWHAGADLLRSKSLDRNSYDSGDWFNVLDWSGSTNGFGRGLPPAPDNEAKWPYQQPLLADPALAPTPADIAAASAAAADLLELRSSTELFRLGDAGLVRQKVTFPGAGPDALPGVVAMHVDDRPGRDGLRQRTDVDRALDGLLVVVNASDEPATLTVDKLAGRRYALSPVQARGTDPVVRATTWDTASGTVVVPARTAAVLVEQAGRHRPAPGRSLVCGLLGTFLPRLCG